MVHAAVVDRAHQLWLREQQQIIAGLGGELTILDVDVLAEEDDGG